MAQPLHDPLELVPRPHARRAVFLCTEEVAATVKLGDRGGTYVGNPLACAAALATLRVVREEKLAERAAEMGERLPWAALGLPRRVRGAPPRARR